MPLALLEILNEAGPLLEPSPLAHRRVKDALRSSFKGLYIDWLFGKRIVIYLGAIGSVWAANEHRRNVGIPIISFSPSQHKNAIRLTRPSYYVAEGGDFPYFVATQSSDVITLVREMRWQPRPNRDYERNVYLTIFASLVPYCPAHRMANVNIKGLSDSGNNVTAWGRFLLK